MLAVSTSDLLDMNSLHIEAGWKSYQLFLGEEEAKLLLQRCGEEHEHVFIGFTFSKQHNFVRAGCGARHTTRYYLMRCAVTHAVRKARSNGEVSRQAVVRERVGGAGVETEEREEGLSTMYLAGGYVSTLPRVGT